MATKLKKRLLGLLGKIFPCSPCSFSRLTSGAQHLSKHFRWYSRERTPQRGSAIHCGIMTEEDAAVGPLHAPVAVEEAIGEVPDEFPPVRPTQRAVPVLHAGDHLADAACGRGLRSQPPSQIQNY